MKLSENKKPPFWYLGEDVHVSQRLAELLLLEAKEARVPILHILPNDVCEDVFLRDFVPNGTQPTQYRFGEHIYDSGNRPTHYVKLDMRAAFVVAMREPVPLHGLMPVPGHHPLQKSSFWLCETPEWTDSRIGHPCGYQAKPGTNQWYTTRTVKLAEKYCGPINRIRGYVPDTLAGYYPHQTRRFESTVSRIVVERKRFREDKDPEKYEDIKLSYGMGLSCIGVKRDDNGTIKSMSKLRRPDILWTIRSEAYARLWTKAYDAITELDRELVGMIHDSMVFAGNFQTWPKSFRLDSTDIGALVIDKVV